jgi:hypothetical protein
VYLSELLTELPDNLASRSGEEQEADAHWLIVT